MEPAETASSESEQASLAIVPPLVRGPRGRNQIALTFDLGADLGALPILLDTLHSERVPVTFFLTGKLVRSNPAWARHIVADSHELGNLSCDHRDHREVTPAEIREEIRQAERTIYSITGRSSRPYWRAPYGEGDLRVLREVSRAAFVPVYWSLDSLDSGGEPKSAAYLVDRVSSRST